MRRWSVGVVVAALGLAALPLRAADAPAAGGPIQLKIGDAAFRFGLLLQPQVELRQSADGGTGQNLTIRRMRVLVGGNVTKSVFFFVDAENSRVGNANAEGQKAMATGFQTLDAVAEWRLNKRFNVSAGLLRVPTSRDALESTSSEFTLDVNTYAYTATTALAGTSGRDTGMLARGYFLDDRLEYRAGLFSGLREAGARNSLRRAGRVQYDFFDKEVYNLPSYAGSNFGAKKILAVGAAYDQQLDYHGATADIFADIPTRFGAVLGTATYQKLDGNVKLAAALAESRILTVDGGVFLRRSKIGPWARFERRQFTATGTQERRVLAGLNYYPFGNNFNVKAAYGRFTPVAGAATNQYTLQFQAFYY